VEFSISINEACLSTRTETAVMQVGGVVLDDAELGGSRLQLRFPAHRLKSYFWAPTDLKLNQEN
jgi:hypothetical protein